MSHVPEAQPAERAELSTDIAALVARVLRGEAVDTAAKGEELAARYPGVGMSGAMIGEAIVRATGMMSMIRERPQPPLPNPVPVPVDADRASHGTVVDAADGNSGLRKSRIATNEAINAEIVGIAAEAGGPRADPDGVEGPRAAAAAGVQEGTANSLAKGAVAALRRALFKD